MDFDDAANEVYIADGMMNKRIVVYDMNTGEFKRGWGAYGIPLNKIDNSDPRRRSSPLGASSINRYRLQSNSERSPTLPSLTMGPSMLQIK